MKSFLKYLLRLITLACVILVAVACWEAKLVPRLLFGELYRGHVWIQLPPEQPKLMAETLSETRHFPSSRGPLPFTSSLVLDTALQQPGVAQLDCLKDEPDKKAWLIDQLEIDYCGSNGNFIKITMTGKNPDELTKILAAVRLGYLDRMTYAYREHDMRRYMTLERAQEHTVKLLNERKLQLKAQCQQLGVPDRETARIACACALETVAKLQSEDEQLQTKIDGVTKKIALLNGRTAHDEPSEEFRQEVERAESDKEIYETQRETNAQALAQATARLESLNQAVAGMADLCEEMERMQKMYDRMGEQLAGWVDKSASYGSMPQEPVVRRIR